MASLRGITQLNAGYIGIAVTSSACAMVFASMHDGTALPVIGGLPLTLVTICAAIIGYPLLLFVQSRLIDRAAVRAFRRADAIALVGFGAVLAVPPILIDLAIPFPRDINVAPPGSFLFYPAIALVAEVALHLLPLAVLAVAIPRGRVSAWMFLPVVLVEPALQAFFSIDAGLQSWLVFGNVSLISAAQIWVFRKYGFSAMFGLRLAFYFFWHVLWGTLRLHLLF